MRSDVGEGLPGWGDLAAKRLGDPLELAGGLVRAVAQVRRADLGLSHLFGGSPQARLDLGVLARALAEGGRRLVGLGLAERPRLQGGSALAGCVAGGGGRLAKLLDVLQEIALDRDAPLDRVLAPAPEEVLDPPRGPGGEVERIASAADLRSALGLRLGCLGAAQCLERLARGSHRAPEPDVDGVSALTLGLSGDLGGQRAQRGAAALELVTKVVAAGGKCVGASREALARGTEAGQAPPCLGALAVAVGKPGLDLRPLLGDDGEIGLNRVALLLRLVRALLGGGELLGPSAGLGGQKLSAQFVRFALEAGVDVGGLGLLLQRAQAAASLALDVERAVEVVLGALQPKLRAAPALAVLGEAGGLLDEDAAVARLRVDDLLDAALADDGVHLAAEVHVGEDVDDVGQAAARAVQAILAVARAIEAPADRDLGEAERLVIALVGREDDLDLRVAAWPHALAARVDHVLHRSGRERRAGSARRVPRARHR